ncbi:DUF86 domain-containing protein [Peribacillus sp. SCS-155]|uniref:DUF86 domain-containing protein n=1 Tax=Peribacillus sedimenti TaxID=3115297 RepID=UPI0039069CA0
MYFVDRQKIEQLLIYLEKQLTLFEGNKNWDDQLLALSLERIIQTSIDSVLDVGNAMIDGFIMRDPGSFEDIIDILLDENVITESDSVQFKNTLPLRKNLVQEYTDPALSDHLAVFGENLDAFKKYPDAIRQYLNSQLGPVSAFKN